MAHFSIANIQATTARAYSIPVAWMVNRDRHEIAAEPRRVAMYLSRTLPTRETMKGRVIPRHSYPLLAHYFGKRHHTTVMCAVRYTKQAIRRDHETRHKVMEIVATLHREALS
jgi:chromosomal replication initiation ATPase DnaA